MKNTFYFTIALLFVFNITSCTKDDPTPELDQEEVGGAKITFTEVEREAHDDHYHYKDIDDPETETIEFSGTQMLPPVGAHVHLDKGKTYRFQLVATDFAARETQQTFVEKADNHFVFILGIPEGAAEIVYKDKKEDGTNVSVGVTGYLTVTKETESFTLRYIMRHLNNGVKANIDPATDWSNTDFTKFTGSNDLDLKFEAHFVDGDHGH
ncbi:hypothetical protein G5B00_11150 [Parapedobacter sp. SGR-10]|uniref:hypothetical protein n=1 Tax=Parapedobacter sp. SGR-10 TaxID=2710879 RepID=UPI0013D7DFAE|nr:hypothetical protein [Parapedobacter sp. SGR-10]NGF57069.1 hypothetical protein [Parapedobacter sp. SGR-10]